MSRSQVLFVTLAIGVLLCGCSSSGDDGSGTPRTFSTSDLEGVWVIQGITDSYDAYTGGLAIDVDDAGSVTSAVFQWQSSAAAADLAGPSFILDVSVSQAGAVSFIAYMPDGVTVAVALMGHFHEDGLLFQGDLEMTSDAEAVSDQLTTYLNGEFAAARYAAALAGRLPSLSYAPLTSSADSAIFTQAVDFVSGHHVATFTTIGSDPIEEVDVTFGVVHTDGWDFRMGIITPEGEAINLQELVNASQVQRLQEGTSYFLSVDPIDNDLLDAGETFSLNMTQSYAKISN